MFHNDSLAGNTLGKIRKRYRVLEYDDGTIKEGSFRYFINCFGCLSFWIAMPFAIYLANNLWEFIVLSFAINAGAMVIDGLVKKIHNVE